MKFCHGLKRDTTNNFAIAKIYSLSYLYKPILVYNKNIKIVYY